MDRFVTVLTIVWSLVIFAESISGEQTRNCPDYTETYTEGETRKCYAILSDEDVKFMRQWIKKDCNSPKHCNETAVNIPNQEYALQLCNQMNELTTAYKTAHTGVYSSSLKYNVFSQIPGPDVTLSLPTPISKDHLEWIKSHMMQKAAKLGQMFVNVQWSFRPEFISVQEAREKAHPWFKPGDCGILHYWPGNNEKNGFSYLDCKEPFEIAKLVKPENQGNGIRFVACEFDMPTDCETLKNITCEPYTPRGGSETCIVVETNYAVNPGTRLGKNDCRVSQPMKKTNSECTALVGGVISAIQFDKYCNPDCEWSPWVSTKKTCDNDNPCEIVRWTRKMTVKAAGIKTCYGQPNENRPCSIDPTDQCGAIIEKISIVAVLVCCLINAIL